MRFSRVIAALVLALAFCAPARAAFHLFVVTEVFSSADGSVQFVRLHSAFGGQNFVAGITVTASNGSTTHTFTFPSNLSGDTTNNDILLATSNFASLTGGIAPDFIIPANFLFLTNGSVNFGGFSILNYAALPIDGQNSLRVGGTQAVNTPRNFSRASGSVSVPGGACCVGAACTLTLQSACTGTMTIGASCTPNPCSAPPTGTCCVASACSITTQAACTGAWVSGGTCQPTTCGEPSGICCRGSTCVTSVASQCTGAQTAFVSTPACNAVGNNTTPCCRADFNHINGLSVQDIFDFLNAWFAGTLSADVNGGGLSVQDIFDFLNMWFAGC